MTGCTIDSGTFCPSIRTTDCEVYLAGKAYEIRNPAKGASRAGIRMIIARRRNIAV